MNRRQFLKSAVGVSISCVIPIPISVSGHVVGSTTGRFAGGLQLIFSVQGISQSVFSFVGCMVDQ